MCRTEQQQSCNVQTSQSASQNGERAGPDSDVMAHAVMLMGNDSCAGCIACIDYCIIFYCKFSNIAFIGCNIPTHSVTSGHPFPPGEDFFT
jgi:hypothetical protein